MEILYELARLNVKNKKVVESQLPLVASSPIKKLCLIVFSSPPISEEECMQVIYGKRNVAAFCRLKSRLQDILEQSIFLNKGSIDSFDSRISEAVLGYRDAFVSRVLLIKKSFIAIPLIEKAIIKSMKYHSAESVLFQTRILVSHFGLGEYNKYKYAKYLALQEKYFYYYQCELKAENFLSDLQRLQLQSLANPSDETILKAKRYADELDTIKDVNTFIFIYNRYKVRAAYYEYTKNYRVLLEISERAYKEFNTPEHRSLSTLATINLRIVYCLIQSGKFGEVYKIGFKDMNSLVYGSLSWYLIAHYTLKAQLFDGAYIDAIDLVSRMINNPKFSKVKENFKEIFYTTLGYIHLIVESGLAGDRNQLSKMLPEFKIGKFLNTTPVFSKDKRGINVSILLMHIAFLLQRKDYNAIIDRTDSLNQYAYRYLRKDDSFRSNCMIKMVIQMTKADFNPIRTDRYTADLRKQLGHVTLAGSGENIEVEIIPFEVLWDIMRKTL